MYETAAGTVFVFCEGRIVYAPQRGGCMAQYECQMLARDTECSVPLMVKAAAQEA